MAQPDLTEQHPSRVPIHHLAFGTAVLMTAVTIAVQVMGGIEGHRATDQAITSLRVGCVVVWCWYFAAYILHVVCRRFDAIEDRLSQLEGDRVDEDSDLALRRINRRLGGGR